MDASQTYIAVAIMVLVVIAGFLYFTRGKTGKRLTPLAGLAFAFVLAGIILGQESLLGYGLIGIGVILAVMDIIIKNSVGPTKRH
jgi:drug/metabolite transporter (DMT)-like permease